MAHNAPPPSELDHLVSELDQLGRQIRANTSYEDYRHLRKMELWGRMSTLAGYLTACLTPNPLSALLISQGNFARWALVLHPISHGALDGIPGVPVRYTSRGFARGYRRFIDWPDWIKPEHWHVEHDQLHHYHLGTDKDPDVVWRNAEKIRMLRVPRWIRYGLSVLMAAVWKPFYYAPNTLAETRHHRKLEPTNRISWATWNPLRPAGRELWLGCLLPYVLFRFILVPTMFFPLGTTAALNVLLTSLLAELFTNLHSFSMIGPNHTGDDVCTFRTATKSRADFYLRQIIGSVNFPAKNDFGDFLYGGLNYQIEHHLFPWASLRQCQWARPRVRALCSKYGVPYLESNLTPRVLVTLRTMAGSSAPKELGTEGSIGWR